MIKLKRVFFLTIAALGGVSIAVCILALLGSGTLVSISQASQLNPLLDPPVTFLSGAWPSYASGALFAQPYPPRAGEPTRLCAELENHSTTDVFTPTIQFSWSNFGIGTLASPISAPQPVPTQPGGRAESCVTWVPPFAGDFIFSANLVLTGYSDQLARRAIDSDEPLLPNTPHNRVFMVTNQTGSIATITLGMIPHRNGWSYQLSQDVIPNMSPGAIQPVTLTVTPSSDFPISEVLVVDIEGFVGANQLGGFRKTYSPPIILHHSPDPVYAESEISINPYPPQAGQPTALCMDLDNYTAVTQTAEARFSVAPFGIGLPFSPIMSWNPIEISPRGEKQVCVYWVPPSGGFFCAQAELVPTGLPAQISQRNVQLVVPTVCGKRTDTFVLHNPTALSVTVSLGTSALNLPPGWTYALDPPGPVELQPFETIPIQLQVTVPCPTMLAGAAHLTDIQVTQPVTASWPTLNVEGIAGGELLGGIQVQFSPDVLFNTLFLPLVSK